MIEYVREGDQIVFVSISRLARNTKDFLTHTARIYELTRLPDSILKEILINY